MKSILYLLLLLLISRQAPAQITYIPDPEFERFLISQNIDSDGEINGQVLTSDIENITELIIVGAEGWENIQDLTGIEGFVALEKLTVNSTSISTLNINQNSKLKELNCANNRLNYLDLSSNPLLEILYCGNYDIDTAPLSKIESLDFSKNPKINHIDAFNMSTLKRINLKNRNNYKTPNMKIQIGLPPLGIENPDYDPDEIRNSVCFEVDRIIEALNLHFPYSHWHIARYHVAVSYAEDCTLSSTKFNAIKIAIYPNPASHTLHLDLSDEMKIQQVVLFDILGKKVLEQPYIENSISVSELPKGTYILKIVTADGVHTEKILIQ